MVMRDPYRSLRRGRLAFPVPEPTTSSGPYVSQQDSMISNLASIGAGTFAENIPDTKVVPQPVGEEAKEEKGWWGRLFDKIQNPERVSAAFQYGFALPWTVKGYSLRTPLIGGSIPLLGVGLPSITRVDEERLAREEKARSMWMNTNLTPKERLQVAKDVQEDRPSLEAWLSEAATSPYNVIPVGKVFKGVKLGIKGFSHISAPMGAAPRIINPSQKKVVKNVYGFIPKTEKVLRDAVESVTRLIKSSPNIPRQSFAVPKLVDEATVLDQFLSNPQAMTGFDQARGGSIIGEPITQTVGKILRDEQVYESSITEAKRLRHAKAEAFIKDPHPKWKQGEITAQDIKEQLFDTTNPITKWLYMEGRYKQNISEQTALLMARLKPPMIELFGIDIANVGWKTTLIHKNPAKRLWSDGTSRNAFWQEVFQYPDDFLNADGTELTTRQIGNIHDWLELIGKTQKMVADENIKAASDVVGKVPGNWWPGYFTHKYAPDGTLIKIEMSKYINQAKGVVNKSRWHQYQNEAIEAGLRGNPSDAIETWIKAQYGLIKEKRLFNIMRPFGRKAVEHMRPAIYQSYKGFLQDQKAGTRMLKITDRLPKSSSLLKYKEKIPRDTKKLIKAVAHDITAQSRFSEEIDLLQKISRMRKPENIIAATARVNAKVKATIKVINKQTKNARIAAQKEAALAEKNPIAGEKQFHNTPVGDLIFTPMEHMEHYRPELLGSLIEGKISTALTRRELLEFETLLKRLKKPNAFLEKTADVAGAMVGVQAGVDLGVPMIHGLPYFFDKPKLWAKTVKESFWSVVKDDAIWTNHLRDDADVITRMINNNQLHAGEIDYVRGFQAGGPGRREGYIHKALKWFDEPKIAGDELFGPRGAIPVTRPAALKSIHTYGTKLIDKINEQFTRFVILGKIELYKANEHLLDDVIKRINPNQQKLGELISAGKLSPTSTLDDAARFMKNDITYEFLDNHSKMTGTVNWTNLGVSPDTANMYNSVIAFSARYTTAGLAFMKSAIKGVGGRGRALMAEHYGWGGNPVTYEGLAGGLGRRLFPEERLGGLSGAMASETLGRMLSGGMLMYLGLCFRLRQEPNLTPGGGFMTLKIGGIRVGIGSIYTALMKTGVSAVARWLENPNEPATYKELLSEDLWRFARGRLSPMTSLGYDLATGKDFIGDPTTDSWGAMMRTGAGAVTPFWMQSIFDSPRPGWQDAPINMGGDLFGLRAYPAGKLERGKAIADVEAQKLYGLNYDQLDDLRKGQVRQLNPRINELFAEHKALWAKRSDPETITTYFAELNSWNERVFDPGIENAISMHDRGIIDGKQLRKKIDQLSAGKRQYREFLDDDYADVIADLRDYQEDNPPEADAYVQDIALYYYKMNILGGDFHDEEGEYLYDKRAKAEELFKENWGDNVYSYVKHATLVQTNPRLKELYFGREALKGYWTVGADILKRTDNSSLLDIWHQYKDALREDKVDMKLEYPWIVTLESAERKAKEMIREQNPQIDAFLLRWGHTDVLKNSLNLEIGPKPIRYTPVTFRPMVRTQ